MADAMTPRDALDALGDLPRYEERLEARTGGLTCMVWGIAIAGIFMAYTAAGPWLEARGAPWGFALLWVPWVVAGSATTALLWRSHAVTLRRDPDARQGVRLSVLITLLFLALAGGLFVGLDILAGVAWTLHSIMAAASGLCAVSLGLWRRRAWGAGARNLVAAGLLMVVAAAAIGVSSMGETAAGLTASAVVGSAWFGAGLVSYRAG